MPTKYWSKCTKTREPPQKLAGCGVNMSTFSRPERILSTNDMCLSASVGDGEQKNEDARPEVLGFYTAEVLRELSSFGSWKTHDMCETGMKWRYQSSSSLLENIQ